METLFWGSILFVAYVYAGYPVLLATWSALAGRRPRKGDPERDGWPSVSIIVAAKNEARRLPQRLANLLQQRYPGPLEIIVVSDGSSDETAAALAPFLGSGVSLIQLPAGGKPLALNAGVAAARGEILVFADARQQFASDAVLQLARNFTDPQVGGVTGRLVLDRTDSGPDGESAIGDGVGLYWKYETWLRRHESHVWSTLGATGAIYALRRSAWTPLPAETLIDDVLAPMRAVLGGWRVVFDERALAFDTIAANGSTESRRKRRTLAGNYQILAHEPRLLVPGLNPVWLQYCSHKIGRLLIPWALVGAFVSAAALAPHHWWYALALAGQASFYTLAAFGAYLEARPARTRGAVMQPAQVVRTVPKRSPAVHGQAPESRRACVP
jgi:cellulose synthase/poly-beta-1,6-N-acetylglucosamine synthase-like glycosyltransferase